MIYEIVCNETGERYIGSTFTTLAQRISSHKYNNVKICISKQIIDRGDYDVNILEECIEKKDLKFKEREWFDNLSNINLRKPLMNDSDWKLRREKTKTKIECECGGRYTLSHKSQHMKSKKHLGVN